MIAHMDEVIEFLRSATEAELRANRANYSEPDDKKLRQQINEWDRFFSAGLTSGLSRPTGDPPELFASPDYVAAAARQHRRTLFAVARYQAADGREVFRAWLGTPEVGRRGEGMRQSLCVVRESGDLKIVSRYQVCSQCSGARSVSGEPCDSCDGTGWFFRGGIDFGDMGRPLELRKLEAPSDPQYRDAYEALDTL